jgi:hypothetical protein
MRCASSASVTTSSARSRPWLRGHSSASMSMLRRKSVAQSRRGERARSRASSSRLRPRFGGQGPAPVPHRDDVGRRLRIVAGGRNQQRDAGRDERSGRHVGRAGERLGRGIPAEERTFGGDAARVLRARSCRRGRVRRRMGHDRGLLFRSRREHPVGGSDRPYYAGGWLVRRRKNALLPRRAMGFRRVIPRRRKRSEAR